jgi:hypothetical protein
VKPPFLFIHGANSTRRSFAWMRDALKTKHETHFFEYDTHQPAALNIAACQKLVDEIEPVAIIGHSLGGIMATYMKCNARKVTIATPFGGSAIANWLPMYSQLMRDVATTSPLIRGVRNVEIDGKDFLSIVANGLDGGGFDGVVSATSQRAIVGPTYHVFDLNHFEVLVDEDVISVIDDFLCRPATS